jgi:hypothetical protein
VKDFSMSEMTQIVVQQKQGKWLVRWRDTKRHFTGPRVALMAAVDLAQESSKNGKPACVVVVEGDKSKTVWTYGQDVYPPLFGRTQAAALVG